MEYVVILVKLALLQQTSICNLSLRSEEGYDNLVEPIPKNPSAAIERSNLAKLLYSNSDH